MFLCSWFYRHWTNALLYLFLSLSLSDGSFSLRCLYVRLFPFNTWLFRHEGIEWNSTAKGRATMAGMPYKYVQIQFLRVDDALDGSWDEDTREDAEASIPTRAYKVFRKKRLNGNRVVFWRTGILFPHQIPTPEEGNIFATIVDISSQRFYLNFRID